MTSNSRPTLALSGELSIFNAASLREQLMTALDQGGDLDVDLSRITEMDSAGLQLMLAAQREAESRNTSLNFVRHSPAVLAVLDLTDLSGALGAPLIQPDN